MQEPNTLYTVVETDAQLNELQTEFAGYHRDIAETLMYKFHESNPEKDFMLMNMNTVKIETVVFSFRSSMLRGECHP